MDENPKNQQIPLKIDPGLDIDCDAVVWVVESLQQQKLKLDADAKGLARHCAVLWKYECIPDSFKSLGDSLKPRSSSGSLSSADRPKGVGPNTSLGRSSRSREGKKNYETCRQLIIIAIVLGLQTILENEIHTAIWGTREPMESIVPLNFDIEG